MIAGGLPVDPSGSGVPPFGDDGIDPLADVWILALTNLGALDCPWVRVGDLSHGVWGHGMVWVDEPGGDPEGSSVFLLGGGFRVQGDGDVSSTDWRVKIVVEESNGDLAMAEAVQSGPSDAGALGGDDADMPTHQHPLLIGSDFCEDNLNNQQQLVCYEQACAVVNGHMDVQAVDIATFAPCEEPPACLAGASFPTQRTGRASCRLSADPICDPDPLPTRRMLGYAFASTIPQPHGFDAIGGVSGCAGLDCDAWYVTSNASMLRANVDYAKGLVWPRATNPLFVPSVDRSRLGMAGSAELRRFRLAHGGQPVSVSAIDRVHYVPGWAPDVPAPIWGAGVAVIGRDYDYSAGAWSAPTSEALLIGWFLPAVHRAGVVTCALAALLVWVSATRPRVVALARRHLVLRGRERWAGWWVRLRVHRGNFGECSTRTKPGADHRRAVGEQPRWQLDGRRVAQR